MADTIERYTFVDRDRNEHGTYSTTDYEDAKGYARENGLQIVANIYTFSDREYLDDFTAESEEDDE